MKGWSEMEWNWVESLQSEDLITEYEAVVGYTFPEDFKEFVKQYNGGNPENTIFYSKHGDVRKKRVFGDLLSFNKEDICSIWKYNRWFTGYSDWNALSNGEIQNYIMIAGDAFGNMICYDKRTNEIVWIDHEQADFSKAVKPVAKSWTKFVSGLKSK